MFCDYTNDVAKPLTRLLKKDIPFELGFEQETAFLKMKILACTTPTFVFFRIGTKTRVEYNASRIGVGSSM